MMPVTHGPIPDENVTAIALLQVLIVLAKVPTGLFGSLQLFLCPDGEAREECLDKYGIAG